MLGFSKGDDHKWVHLQESHEAAWGLEHHPPPSPTLVSPEFLPENSFFHCPLPFATFSRADGILHYVRSNYQNIIYQTMKKEQEEGHCKYFENHHQQYQFWWVWLNVCSKHCFACNTKSCQHQRHALTDAGTLITFCEDFFLFYRKILCCFHSQDP